MRCTATTKRGRRCLRAPLAGTDLCHAHSATDVGRPEKLTDEVERRICEAIRAGNTKEVAAAFARISRSTFHRWLQKADEPGADPRYRRLTEAIAAAKAEAEVHAVAVMRQAMPKDWRAALAYLQCRHPDRWSRHRVRASPELAPRGSTGADIDITDPSIRQAFSEILRASTDPGAH